MGKYESQRTKGKSAKQGKFLLILGLIVTLAGIVLLIIGFTYQILYAFIGGVVLILGLTATIFGMQKRKQGSGRVEIITVKCRNCGYLERSGAEFCSKCGESM